jgi:bifunctional non-homologous end joining protein LigD
MIDCIRVGARIRDLLADLGLKSFAKTSGGKGLHLYVPLNTPTSFDHTKVFAHTVAAYLSRDDPKRVTSTMAKSERGGKVFIDWSQNDRGKTTVGVYSLRARETPTVSTPVTWEELEEAAKHKAAATLVFEAMDVLNRVDELGDLFAPTLKLKQRLPSFAA